MPEFPHLANAPIVEALIFFQADVSAFWNLKSSDELRPLFGSLWPDHAEIQEMRRFTVSLQVKGGEEPKQEFASPGLDGLMYRSSSKQTVYQARRDGFIASWLKPYPDWEAFQGDAVENWERYAQLVGLPVLHSVLVKFINRLEFPKDSPLMQNFTTPPSTPPKLQWEMGQFTQQAEYLVPHTPYTVQTALTRTLDVAPELSAFVLDIEVKMREPITASEHRVDEVLGQMRVLKNNAFFGILTKAGWQRYQ
jgi:uncharacterized protein (TIGR04255 family)